MKFRFVFVIVISLSAALAAGAGGRKAAPKPSPASRGGVPASAVMTAPDTYRYVDPDGKAWLYRKSPFGWMKVEEKAARPDPAVAAMVADRVVEEGDTLRFEKKTPFGTQRWSRRKSELTEAEKLAWERLAPSPPEAKIASQE